MKYSDVDRFVDAQHWSDTTKHTSRSKLYTLSKLLSETSDLNIILKTLESRGYSRYTVQIYFSILAKCDSFLQLKLGIDTFLKANAFYFRNSYKEKTDSLSKESFTRILEDARSHSGEMYNLILMMGGYGLRLFEAQTRKWSDFINDSELKVIGKGLKQRIVPCLKSDFYQVAPQASPEGYIAGFINPRKILQKHNVTPHSLRAYFISEKLNSGILNIEQVRRVAGHSSIMTTQRYLRTDFEEIKRKMLGY